MDAVIREGALRLQTTETTCDVILSCHGNRLMAHKLILSIASPVLRDLLLDDTADPTVLILPDINFTTMSSILDYIYTGSVIVYSNLLEDFLSVATLLKIQIDIEKSSIKQHRDGYKLDAIVQKIKKKEESLMEATTTTTTALPKKHLRKLPNLLPLNMHHAPKTKTRKMCGQVIPSPWCPRIEPVLVDPRKDYLANVEKQLLLQKLDENDTNNNFQFATSSASRFHPHLASQSPTEFFHPNKSLSPAAHAKFQFPPESSIPQLKQQHHDDIADRLTPNPSNNLESNSNETEDDERLSSSDDKCDTKCTRSGSSSSGSTNNNNHNHNSTNNKQKPFKCDECGKCFSQLRNYKYHRSVHEGTKEFAAKCPECGKVFNDRGYLSSHMKIHRDRKEYACPHCPKRFNQRVAYNMHLRIHTGVKPHECTVCGKSFSRKMLLKQHQRVHTGERPYSCPECGKTFADRSNMSLHARLHTGVKPYACSLCPKSFTKKHHLKTHMNFHTGLKPYTCQKCGLAFSQSSNMRTHYKKCILKDVGSGSEHGGATTVEKKSS